MRANAAGLQGKVVDRHVTCTESSCVANRLSRAASDGLQVGGSFRRVMPGLSGDGE